jgi:hypothetical protein
VAMAAVAAVMEEVAVVMGAAAVIDRPIPTSRKAGCPGHTSIAVKLGQ